MESDLRKLAEGYAEFYGWTFDEAIRWLRDQLTGECEPVRILYEIDPDGGPGRWIDLNAV